MNEFQTQINRAIKLLHDLEISYSKDLKTKTCSEDTINLTPEILSKISNIFDQAFHQYFHSIKGLATDNHNHGNIYFPINRTLQDLKSQLGRYGLNDLEQIDKKVYDFLVSIQPFSKVSNKWLTTFKEYKDVRHIKLIPHKVVERKRRTIKSGKMTLKLEDEGKIVIGNRGAFIINGHAFEGNQVIDTESKILGGPPDLTSTLEKWTAINIDQTKIDCLWLCTKAVTEGEKIISEFTKLY